MTFLILMFLFVGMPVLELYLLIEVGQSIGVLDTVLFVLLTGLVGAWVARSQGHQVLQEMQRKTQRGELPAEELLQGLLIFVGGLLMLTPGFVTDFLGFSMILPGLRRFYVIGLRRFILQKMKSGAIHVHTTGDFQYQNS